jgi:hypothetical protein
VLFLFFLIFLFFYLQFLTEQFRVFFFSSLSYLSSDCTFNTMVLLDTVFFYIFLLPKHYDIPYFCPNKRFIAGRSFFNVSIMQNVRKKALKMIVFLESSSCNVCPS